MPHRSEISRSDKLPNSNVWCYIRQLTENIPKWEFYPQLGIYYPIGDWVFIFWLSFPVLDIPNPKFGNISVCHPAHFNTYRYKLIQHSRTHKLQYSLDPIVSRYLTISGIDSSPSSTLAKWQLIFIFTLQTPLISSAPKVDQDYQEIIKV